LFLDCLHLPLGRPRASVRGDRASTQLERVRNGNGTNNKSSKCDPDWSPGPSRRHRSLDVIHAIDGRDAVGPSGRVTVEHSTRPPRDRRVLPEMMRGRLELGARFDHPATALLLTGGKSRFAPLDGLSERFHSRRHFAGTSQPTEAVVRGFLDVLLEAPFE